VVVDELLDVLGDATEKGFAVEDGGQLAADVVEERESFCLIGISKKQRRRGRFSGSEARRGREFCGLFH